MCLCLYFTAVEPRHYLLPRQTSCGEGKNRFDQTHVIDTISQRSDLKMGFCLVRVFIQLFTGAEFFINHPLDLGKQLPDQDNGEVMRLTTTPWQMYFDGSSTQGGAGAGLVFFSPNEWSSFSPFIPA